MHVLVFLKYLLYQTYIIGVVFLDSGYGHENAVSRLISGKARENNL